MEAELRSRSVKQFDAHRRKLCEMIHFALVEIRLLGSTGKAERSGFSRRMPQPAQGNLEKEFSLEYFRDTFLVDYQEKHPD